MILWLTRIQVFPRCSRSPEALVKLTLRRRDPIEVSLVSDFFMPEPPPTPQKIEVIFKQYLCDIDELNLAKRLSPLPVVTFLRTPESVSRNDRSLNWR